MAAAANAECDVAVNEGSSGGGDDVAESAATSTPRLAHMGAHERRQRGGVVVGGGGKQTRSDGAMFGNRWLPNIEIISNQF